MSDKPNIPIDPEVPEAVSKVVADAYYPKIIGLPEAARTRAQAAFTISSGIATSLLAFSLFAKIEEYPDSVQILAVLALVFWLGTAAVYISAVAAPVGPPQELKATETATDFANKVLNAAVTDRNAIDARQNFAHMLSAVAAAFTLLALVFALREGKEEPAVASMSITLTESAKAMVDSSCDQPPAELVGKVDKDSLAGEIVSFTLDAGVCRADATTFSVPREDVVSIVTKRT